MWRNEHFCGVNLHDLQFHSYYALVEHISRNATFSYPYHEQLGFTHHKSEMWTDEQKNVNKYALYWKGVGLKALLIVSNNIFGRNVSSMLTMLEMENNEADEFLSM